MSKAARTRQNRRERRLAKASGFMRPGKSNPKKIGHGGSGQVSSYSGIGRLPKMSKKQKRAAKKQNAKGPETKSETFKIKLEDLLK